MFITNFNKKQVNKKVGRGVCYSIVGVNLLCGSTVILYVYVYGCFEGVGMIHILITNLATVVNIVIFVYLTRKGLGLYGQQRVKQCYS